MKQFDYLQSIFIDLSGNIKSLDTVLPQGPNHFPEEITFEGRAVIPKSLESSQTLVLKTDPSTMVFSHSSIVEDVSHNYYQVLCDINTTDGAQHPICTRSVLKNQIDRWSSQGYQLLLRANIEFYLLNKDHKPIDNESYFDAADQVIQPLITWLTRKQIKVRGIHHAFGPGQYKLTLDWTDAIDLADTLVLSRQMISNWAKSNGLNALFMPKPFAEHEGSGLHIMMRISDEAGNDILADHASEEASFHSPSEKGKSIIMGMLKMARKTALISNGNINSYKRFDSTCHAPTHNSWATDFTQSLVRVPHRLRGLQHIEWRQPDAMAQPYLVIAVLLGNAIKGLNDSLELVSPAMEKNVNDLTTREMGKWRLKKLPEHLDEAISRSKSDEYLKELIGPMLYQSLVSIKKEEWQNYQASVHDWEHRVYGVKKQGVL